MLNYGAVVAVSILRFVPVVKNIRSLRIIAPILHIAQDFPEASPVQAHAYSISQHRVIILEGISQP